MARKREISTFNVAMLDVISSAMGAFLLLFLIMAERRESAEASLAEAEGRATAAETQARASEIAEAQARQQQAESERERREAEEERRRAEQEARQQANEQSRAERERQSAEARARQAEQELQQAQQQIEQLEQQLADLENAMGGDGIANCRVTTPTIQVSAWDSGSVDGDLVRISLNGTVTHPSVSLPAASNPWRGTFQLRRGTNVITIHALSEGSSAPNTAGVRIDPCNGRQPYDTSWNMTTGEERTITVVYR
jgi:flagellar motor protein MotB